jgi:hypothetical protein
MKVRLLEDARSNDGTGYMTVLVADAYRVDLLEAWQMGGICRGCNSRRCVHVDKAVNSLVDNSYLPE